MSVKFFLISINEELRKRGKQLAFIGLGIVLLNVFLLTVMPLMPEKTGVWISGLGIIIAISGLLMIGSAQYNKENVGFLSVDDAAIIIAEKGKNEISLERKDFRFEIKNPGFEGMQSTYNILMFGSIIPHPGINELKIYNQQQEYKLDILIESKERLNALLALT